MKLLCLLCGTYTARAYHAEAPHDDWFVKCSTCNNSLPPTDAMVHSEAEAIAAWQSAWAFGRIVELEAECNKLRHRPRARKRQQSVETLPLIAQAQEAV